MTRPLFALVLLFAGQAFADTAPSDTESIAVRATMGPAFYSKADPVSGGLAFGAEVGLGFSELFSVNATLSHSAGSKYVSGTTSNDFATSLTFFGLNPSLGIRRPRLSASFGLVAGALIVSTENRATSAGVGTVTTNASETRAAIGLNAHLDVPIVGGFIFTLTPEYLHALGSAPNAGIAMLRAGLGFAL